MLFLYCSIWVLPLTPLITRCSSRDFMQKSAWMVPLLIGSRHTCYAGHSKSLQDMLFVEFRCARCSVLFSFLFTLGSWQTLLISFAWTITFYRRFRTVLIPTNWIWVCAECVEKCWIVLSSDKHIDDEKQTKTQWSKNWRTPLWTII